MKLLAKKPSSNSVIEIKEVAEQKESTKVRTKSPI